MGYTIAEKILLAHCGRKNIAPGDFIEAAVDLALGNDITAPIAIEEFKKSGALKVFDNKKIVLVPDHFAPAKDLRSANQCKILANFAMEQEIKTRFNEDAFWQACWAHTCGFAWKLFGLVRGSALQ